MNRYDAIVCGAGPAGCQAARLLAGRGFRTLLIEKERLPRYKPCGGGLTRRALASLPGGDAIQGLIERWVRGACCFGDDGRSAVVCGDGPVVAMVMRDRLDARLAAEARSAGADLIEGARVDGIEPGAAAVSVIADGARYTAAYLVAADGAASSAARLPGLDRKVALYPALSAELHPPAGALDAAFDELALYDLGAVRGGYAWAFPKGDHYSVGISSFSAGVAALRDGLRAFVARHPALRACRVERSQGWFIPVRQRGGRAAAGRVLLAGDAAGCADPFTGEGISHALTSGELAAGAVARALAEGGGGTLEAYGRVLRDRIFRDLAVGGFLGRVYYRFPRFAFNAVLRDERACRHFTRLMAGEADYRRLLKVFLRNWFRLRWTRPH